MLDKQLQELKNNALTELEGISSDEALRSFELKYFSRKEGKLTVILRGLSKMSTEDKKTVGKLSNDIKGEIEKKIEETRERLESKKYEDLAAKEWIDITLPGKEIKRGHLHPMTIIQREVEEIFSSMGFAILDGPELESDFYNFEALNIPKTHPARDMQDTFYLDNDLVLRTHTSPVQIRSMEIHGAPLRVIAPGRVFRYEASDASHDNTFYQIEGLVIDKDINLSHLKAIMQEVLKKIFKKEINLRFRPGYFPFVEPGLELDLECLICGGKGCSVCKRTGWIEFMGAGMVHPNVLCAGKIDPKKWQGIAFGFGLTRLAMMKYGINNIRLLMSGDIRFLEQF